MKGTMHKTSLPQTLRFFTLLAGLVGISAFGQTTLWYDSFETNTIIYGTATNDPVASKWVVFDPSDEDVVPTLGWDRKDKSFGGEGVHTGSYKLYCAGRGFVGNTTSPRYTEGDGAITVDTDIRRVLDLRGCTDGYLS